MAVGYNPRIVTDGLVLALDAGNTKSYPGSGTTWYDLSGNGYNASLDDGAYFSDGSVVFDGDNDGVDLGRAYFETPDAFSVVVWFKPDGTKGGAQMLVYTGEGDGFGGNDEFHVHFNDSSNSADAFMQSSVNNLNFGTGSSSIPTDKFSQVTFTISGLSGTASATLYLNGESKATDTASSVVRTAYTNTLVGRPYSLTFPTPPRSYDGLIQTVLIYDKELTASEVKQNFNAHRGRFGI
jgi:hypothetical protein